MTTKTGFKVTSVSTLGTKNVLYVEVKDYEHNGRTRPLRRILYARKLRESGTNFGVYSRT